AGHDPDTMLAHAVADARGLQSAKSPAQVLHHRITTTYAGRLTPNVSDLAELIPAETPAEWHPPPQRPPRGVRRLPAGPRRRGDGTTPRTRHADRREGPALGDRRARPGPR